MKKAILSCLLIFCLLVSCTGKESSTSDAESKNNGFAIILHSEFLFSCDLPENWEYCIYPQYSKSFYEYEGERDESLYVSFHYSETNPDAAISLVSESASAQKPFEGLGGETEDYTFADGSTGMRRVSNEEHNYKEYIYHPDSGYYVTLNTTKADYSEYETELRAFLDSIAFGKNEISEKVSENANKQYRLHVWNEFLQADLTTEPGITTNAVWEWEDTNLVFRELELYSAESNAKLVLTPAIFTSTESSQTWERCKLESGLIAYRTAFEENGQNGTEYKLPRFHCTIKLYGEETEQMKEILNSITIR